MNALRTAAAVLLAGAVSLPLMAPDAQARDGRNAAIVGGAVLGALAGAAIANAADDAPLYQRAQWDNGYGEGGGYYAGREYGGYDAPTYYTYRRVYRPRTYVYVQPEPEYGYAYDDWRWRRWHHWHHRPYHHGFGEGD